MKYTTIKSQRHEQVQNKSQNGVQFFIEEISECFMYGSPSDDS